MVVSLSKYGSQNSNTVQSPCLSLETLRKSPHQHHRDLPGAPTRMMIFFFPIDLVSRADSVPDRRPISPPKTVVGDVCRFYCPRWGKTKKRRKEEGYIVTYQSTYSAVIKHGRRVLCRSIGLVGLMGLILGQRLKISQEGLGRSMGTIHL